MSQTLEQRIQTLERHLSAEPQSPLFARLAGCYLEAGRSQEALSLCDTGLAHHPFYTTGHLMKGKVLLALNMRSEARREFEFVHEMLPFNESVQRLLSGIPAESLTGTTPPPAPSVSPMITEAPVEEPAAPEASAEQVLSQFTEESPSVEAPQTLETPEQPAATEQAEDVFGLATAETTPAEIEPPTTAEPPPAVVQPSESFESFSERKRGELFGLENSLSLEEYLAEGDTTGPSAPIEEPPAEPLATQPPAETTSSDEDPFAALTQFEEQQSPPVAVAPAEEQTTEDTEDPFSQLQQTVEEFPSQETGTVTTAEETEDAFAQLRPSPEEAPAAEAEQAAEEPSEQTTEQPKDQIEELAEKLKDARKITPVINLSEHTVTPTSEEDTPSGTGFVTPTLAEIYAKQGWFDDAIKAYKTLASTKPVERERYEARIRELEEEKKKQAGPA